MKRIAMILLFSLLTTLGIAAQEKPKQEAPKADAQKTETKPEAKPTTPLPPVDEILDKYVKAIGGKEAIEKLSSRVIKGSFEIESMNMAGSFETFAKAPNKSATVVSIPGFGTVNQVFDGSKGWAADPMSGLRELDGAELAAMKRDSDFYRDINFKKHFPKMEVKGKEKVGSSEAYVIEATPTIGSPEKLYFDVNTGLLVRVDAERENPQGKMPVETYFEDYKAVDGVKIPHAMRQVNPAFAMTLKFADIKHNGEIEETKFNKPAAP